MVEIMDRNFQMVSGIFGRCDACTKNFQKSICAFNCSPKQSQFLTAYIEEVGEDDEKGNAPIETFFF